MKVSVSTELCQGHARCVEFCSEVFDVDDQGFVVLLKEDVGNDLVDDVLEAVANCPERAISAAD